MPKEKCDTDKHPFMLKRLEIRQLVTRSLNLPKKPVSLPTPQVNQSQKTDNIIFIRLPEDHPSRTHHVHAVKSALAKKLELQQVSPKVVQKVKSGLALIPSN